MARDKANWDNPAEASFLNIGYIPGWGRVYEDGVEIWPGNEGKIPEDWDGYYPDNSVPVRSNRNGRSRRR